MGAVAVALAGAAIVLAIIQALSTDLPSLEQLETYRPRLITKVLGADSTVIKEFYTQRRVQVPLDSISPFLLQGLLDTEDIRFYTHWGIDPVGILRAFAVNVLAFDSDREGASTITQQLARDLYLHKRKTYKRKIREAITAIQIERTYAKDEIIQMYFTQVYFGHGSYGIQSAAQFYFGVNAKDLTLSQSAVLIGLLKSPNNYSPKRNMRVATIQRNIVLKRMLTGGHIDQATYQKTINEPIVLAEGKKDEVSVGPYFTEWVRKKLEKLQSEYGFDYYKDGLIVHTTLDPILQNAADVAVDSHVTFFQRDFNKRFTRNGLLDWLENNYKDSLKVKGVYVNDDSLQQMVMLETADDTLYSLAFNELRDRLVPDTVYAIPTHFDSLTNDFVYRDSVVYDTISKEKILEGLEYSPRGLAKTVMQDTSLVDSILKEHFTAQVASVALNPENGDVWAMVGGRDFDTYKWNNAVQATRQPGSVFKPFVYTTAIDNGIYANYQMLNMVQPLLMDDGTWWRPENYNVQNRGEYVCLRDALRQSLNNVTVRMVAGEDAIVPIREIIRYARRMGITTRLQAVPAMALGSNDVIPIDIVSAYSVFPSGGVHSKPRGISKITDRYGQEIVQFPVKREVVLSEETAAIMTNLLAGVINAGTGGSARWKWGFRAPAAGKTGTTNNYSNAWFVGFTPHIVAGVWIGFDDPSKSLGTHQSGARAALPVWAIFMNEAYKNKNWAWDDFELPVGVVKVNVCKDTGLRAGPYCPHVYEELFRRGDEPIDACDTHGSSGGGW